MQKQESEYQRAAIKPVGFLFGFVFGTDYLIALKSNVHSFDGSLV
jgi:hypothetical protein